MVVAYSEAELTELHLVAIIEPGTMKGFETILALRDNLIAAGGHIIAPCPHERACPMASADKLDADWCHFASRFERSSLHRRIKGAELGYEDEKYSYIAASKSPVQLALARIIRHPMRRAGFTQLQLCAEEGLADVTVTDASGRRLPVLLSMARLPVTAEPAPPPP